MTVRLISRFKTEMLLILLKIGDEFGRESIASPYYMQIEELCNF